jgi:hypothetical protein
MGHLVIERSGKPDEEADNEQHQWHHIQTASHAPRVRK